AKTLRGVTTLYNTYWVRFPYGETTYERAVENTLILFRAAGEAGVRRIVHISITGASEDSPLPYFQGKGRLEKALRNSGLSYAIIRPTVIFGTEDILINNIAWLLRKFPVFAVPGTGDYRLQPVFVEDVAELAVEAAHGEENAVVDAVGPEVYTFNELVTLIARRIGSRARILHLPPPAVLWLGRVISWLVKDVVITPEEVAGLAASLLVSRNPPTGRTLFSRWLDRNAEMLGKRYASELDRHYRFFPGVQQKRKQKAEQRSQD
ncbi:MAG: NAD(P)H-binding protein, partial [Desulfotomaculales bacterium]